MRKLFSFLISLSLITIISSCDQSKVTVYTEDGCAHKVDTSIMNQYGEVIVKRALKRDRLYSEENLPKDASNFGEKKAEFKWRAFIKDLNADNFFREEGFVTVVHYEKGLEIIKDGQHWYYDGYDFEEGNVNRYSGALSVLHSPRWEPVKVRGDLSFEYDYPKDNNCLECFHISGTSAYNLKLNQLSDLYYR